MGFLVFDEWATACAAVPPVPPVWHANLVPDILGALGALSWSICYVLLARLAFKDRSYGMPLPALCLNIGCELIYGFVYPPGKLNGVIYGQWLVVDVFLCYAIVKYGGREWGEGGRLVGDHLAWVTLLGTVAGTVGQLAVAGTLIPSVGRQVVFWNSWVCQVFISVGCIAQLLSRGHTRGHSWGIWWTRMLGTAAASAAFYWRLWYWPERFAYVWTPLGKFLLVGTHILDAAYPLVFSWVKRHEEARRRGSVVGNRKAKGL